MRQSFNYTVSSHSFTPSVVQRSVVQSAGRSLVRVGRSVVHLVGRLVGESVSSLSTLLEYTLPTLVAISLFEAIMLAAICAPL